MHHCNISICVINDVSVLDVALAGTGGDWPGSLHEGIGASTNAQNIVPEIHRVCGSRSGKEPEKCLMSPWLCAADDTWLCKRFLKRPSRPSLARHGRSDEPI